MLKIISFIICFNCAFAYFTLSGKCPDKVALQEDFRLADVCITIFALLKLY